MFYEQAITKLKLIRKRRTTSVVHVVAKPGGGWEKEGPLSFLYHPKDEICTLCRLQGDAVSLGEAVIPVVYDERDHLIMTDKETYPLTPEDFKLLVGVA